MWKIEYKMIYEIKRFAIYLLWHQIIHKQKIINHKNIQTILTTIKNYLKFRKIFPLTKKLPGLKLIQSKLTAIDYQLISSLRQNLLESEILWLNQLLILVKIILFGVFVKLNLKKITFLHKKHHSFVFLNKVQKKELNRAQWVLKGI